MADSLMNSFYKQGQFADAIDFASEDERKHFDEWDYLFLAMCFYKTKRFQDYIELFKEFHKKYPDSDKLDNNLGWCLYHVFLKNFDFETGNRNQYLKQVDYILNHCDDSQFSPKNFIAGLAADAVFKSKLAVNPDYELGNKYLSVVDPLTLDLKERIFEVDGRTVRTSSEREQWYNRKTKALEKLGKYEECIAFIDDAFKNVDIFHNNGDHWLNYRRALCYYNLGDLDKSEKTVNDILRRFSHWCLYGLLFEISVAKNDTDAAIRYGAICSLADKNHKLRVSFYEKYGAFLLHNGFPREAVLHYKLAEIIRQEEGWKDIRLPDGFSYPEEAWELDKKAILKELVPFWKKETEHGIAFYEGVIERIQPEGKSGFIQSDDGNSYYFNIRDFTHKVNDLQVGRHVRYTLKERFNKKRNEMTLNAVQINYI